MCSSKEDDYMNLLVISQNANRYFSRSNSSFSYVLLRLDLLALCGNSIDNYLSHIENIRASILLFACQGFGNGI